MRQRDTDESDRLPQAEEETTQAEKTMVAQTNLERLRDLYAACLVSVHGVLRLLCDRLVSAPLLVERSRLCGGDRVSRVHLLGQKEVQVTRKDTDIGSRLAAIAGVRVSHPLTDDGHNTTEFESSFVLRGDHRKRLNILTNCLDCLRRGPEYEETMP